MEALREKIAARLAPEGVEVTGARPLVGGACQDNFLIEATSGGESERLVLRSDAENSLPGSVDRSREFPVICAAHGAGVPTPRARWLTPDLVAPGRQAYFLDWAEGAAIGAKVTRDPQLAAARAALPDQLADALAAIHQITPQTHPDLPLDGLPDPTEWALRSLRGMLDRLPEPHPALDLAWRWLSENRPASQQIALVHGDYRTGNFLVTPDGLSAVLDWEFTHWGDPLEDIGWLCVRDWRFGQLDKPAGGICDRATFYRAYERASGRALDPADVHYWEICGNLRWGAAAIYQGVRYLQGRRDLELLAIPRRAAEMEYELLRLIELGPPIL